MVFYVDATTIVAYMVMIFGMFIIILAAIYALLQYRRYRFERFRQERRRARQQAARSSAELLEEGNAHTKVDQECGGHLSVSSSSGNTAISTITIPAPIFPVLPHPAGPSSSSAS